MTKNVFSNIAGASPNNHIGFLIDLIIYITIMFLVREIYIPEIPFIANGLFWSLSTLAVATWRMKARGITWAEIGLRKPKNLGKTLAVSVIIIAAAISSILIFQVFKDQLPLSIAPDTSSGGSKFGDLKGNYPLFFSIIFFVWIESFLEEILDRGFLINWFERLFSKSWFATVFAVIMQALIFGFRHSHDFSERSITVGLIGLVMGIAYVAFGRNLWPLIIAHCLLNTSSMLDRV